MPTDQPRTYKHQLTEAEFVFAFTATAEAFTERADEMREKGVERLTGWQIQEQYNIKTGWRTEEHWFTYMSEAEIETNKGIIELTDLTEPVPGLVLHRCLLPSLGLKNCALAGRTDEPDQQPATGLILNETTTGDFRILGSSTTGDFRILGSSTTGGFSIYEKSATGDFSILGSSTTGNFSISGSSTTGDFSISGSSTTGNFWISGSSTTSDFSIEEASTTGNFSISDSSTTGDFWISGSSTTGDFSIADSSTTGDFSIEEKSTTGDFSIETSKCTSFSGVDLFCSFSFIGATVPQLRLTNCHIPKLDIRSGCKLEAYLADSTINLIDLRHLTLSKDSVVSLFNCTVYACLMEEFAVLGQLYLRQLKLLAQPFAWYDPATRAGENPSPKAIEQLQKHAEHYKKQVQKLTGAGDKELAIKTPTFRIAQSSLSKTEFTNCDLRAFQFEFSNAKITEVFMSGGTVPLENIVIHGEKPNTLPWEEQKVSVYNQLKKIFENQGDVYWSTYFQAKTAEHQQRVLIKRRENKTDKNRPSRFDIWTFRLNGWSNGHGESWERALVFILINAGVFYCLFLWSIGQLYLFSSTDIDWVLVEKSSLFLDPTHRTELVFKDFDTKPGARIIDFLSRIFVGYGIYQFIAAFRKHGKK